MSVKICLDAGHYGKYNRSPGVPEYYESEMNWKLHLLLKKELEKYGITVITTRSDPASDLELTRRGRLSKDCDLFLSLHSNAVGGEMNEAVDRPVGIHFVDDDCGPIDEQSKTIARLLANVVREVMQTNQPAQVYSRLSDRDRDGDGEKNDDYYGVLWGAHQVGVPGVILEHSFHTCTRSAKWLLEEENLRALAVAEADALAKFFGVGKHPFADVPQDAYYAEAVRWAWEKGILFGRDETHFDPDSPLTRAEMVAMLFRALGKGG